MYNEFKQKTKEGDNILTEINSYSCQRLVTVKGNGIVCEGVWFHWDFFFSVNHPIKIIDISKEKTT